MAQKIAPQVIDEIRQRVNIVDVIGDYVQLKKQGKNYSGLCPFHEEKSPSFSVTEDKQIFKCFGCGKGGNVFTFIQDIEGVTFPEAVKKVADRVHVPLELDEEVVSPQSQKLNRLLLAHTKANELYQHLLKNTKVGEGPLAYLEQRGLDAATIERFGIGFAPENGEVLLQVLKKEGFQEEELVATGLFNETAEGRLFDRFQSRITFPLQDANERVVGFSGRIYLPEGQAAPPHSQAKYLNSPETALFTKRTLLYNFGKAKSEIRKTGSAFLFEGFMDVIAAYQGGILNGIASMGTSLTSQQIQGIQRVTKDLVLCFDGDAPGQNAIAKSLSHLQANSQLRLKVVMLPEKLDPDEYLRKYGGESFKNYLGQQQITPFQFKEAYLQKNYDLANEQGRADFLQELLREVANVPSIVERDILLHHLEEHYHVSLEILQQQLKSFSNAEVAAQLAKVSQLKGAVLPQREKLTQLEKAQRHLLYRFFTESEVRQRLREQTTFVFPTEVYQELFLLMDGYALAGGEMAVDAFSTFLGENQRLLQVATTIFMQELAPEVSTIEIEDLLAVIQKAKVQQQITEKQRLQKEAHRLGDQALELTLTVEIVNLKRQLLS